MPNKHGFRKEKYELLQQVCPGSKKHKGKKDLKCKGLFLTRDPLKIFCSTRCRIKIWIRNNRESTNIVQRQSRINKKKKFDQLVQDIIDSKGIQDN